MRLDLDKAEQIIHLLAEGVGIRACERLTGANRRTILDLLETVGEKCARMLDIVVHNVQVESVQCDEIFSFVLCKQAKNVWNDPAIGTQYTYLAVDRRSKFILSHLVGQRTPENTTAFMADLRKRLGGRCQVTTDGLDYYGLSVGLAFGRNVDFAQ